MKYNNEELKLIEKLSNAKGACGFEDDVLDIAREEMRNFATIKEDKMRNIYFYSNNNTGNKPIVMLDAHSDEVSFMVHSIKPNGTLRVVSLGRWTNSTLPSSKVKVRNALGEWISGVFVMKPSHFRTASDNVAEPLISSLAVDVGATSIEEAKNIYNIRIGEPIVPATLFEFDDKNGLMFGKAFDCRIGCAALLETMKRISNLKLDVDVVGVLSSQEELGERGCKVSVSNVKPDVAICYEGCPADDTFTESYAIQTALKKGPMFRHMDVSAINSPRFQRYVLDLAQDKGLKLQESVREGGGNDAAPIQTIVGAPSVTAGIPVRYVHSMNGICAYEDYESTVEVVVEILKNLNKDVIDRL